MTQFRYNTISKIVSRLNCWKVVSNFTVSSFSLLCEIPKSIFEGYQRVKISKIHHTVLFNFSIRILPFYD